MDTYIEHLIMEIRFAAANAKFPKTGGDINLGYWITAEEEDRIAPERDLEEWTGIMRDQLPEPEILNKFQLSRLLDELKKLLDAYNCSFILQIQVPEYIQYATIRDNFRQRVKVRTWHYGFFELCPKGTEHRKCTLGKYCQCAFYAELCSGFEEDNCTPEDVEIEINDVKRKYENDWRNNYPYHLDPEYDDENENPYRDGCEEEEDDEDDWWKN